MDRALKWMVEKQELKRRSFQRKDRPDRNAIVTNRDNEYLKWQGPIKDRKNGTSMLGPVI
ncbi:MAG: hypothetical protein CBB94_13190 [Gammaproteobacteria bacterium TMED34]|nr:MAG: hypothetical protein CBB94_13190 [Gammaproteobacteria bacterium TMED34]